MRVLADDSFVSGAPYTKAGWIVVPFQFTAEPNSQVSHASPPYERWRRRWKHSAVGDGDVSARLGGDAEDRLQVRRTAQARRDDAVSGHQRVRAVRSAQRGAVLIGAHTTGRLGARHDPEVALQALNESRSEVEELFSQYSIIILIGTGGKGTGSGTMFPLAQIARQQKKLVIPIFVRPSFERHEVDKRHYDHAVSAIEQFDSAGHPADRDSERPRIHGARPAAAADRLGTHECSVRARSPWPDLRLVGSLAGRSVRSLDPVCRPRPSANRLRRDRSSGLRQPNDQLVEHAARRCCDNPYYAFHKPAGTSLICIEGDWSNLVDARIKGRIAVAMGADANSPYSPLYARAVGMPKTVGCDGVVCRVHGRAPAARRRLEPRERRASRVPTFTEPWSNRSPSRMSCEIACAGEPRASPTDQQVAESTSGVGLCHILGIRGCPQPFRSGGTGAGRQRRHIELPLDAIELRRLLGMMWFRTVFARLHAIGESGSCTP